MAVHKRGDVWWYKFVWQGQPVRESSKQGNKCVAEQMEAARKTALAKGEVGLEGLKEAPTFAEFSKRFLQWVTTEKAEKPNTVRFYEGMVRILLRHGPLARARLDRIDKALIATCAEQRRKARRTGVNRRRNGTIEHTVIDKPVSVAAVNRELATLRRMLNLAEEWGVVAAVPRIKLAGGERQNERILSHEEESAWLTLVPQLLHDFVTVCLDTGMRPGEIQKLRCEDVHFRGSKPDAPGYLHVPKGKSRNARRNLVLTDRVRDLLLRRHGEQGGPTTGWVFPGTEEDGSVNYDAIDSQHDRVVAKVSPDQPLRLYDFRHTALTRQAESQADVFAIRKIAGHSDLKTTSRYVHPAPEHIQEAFTRLEA